MVSPVTQFLQPNTELHRTSKALSVVTKRPRTNWERVPTPTTSKWGDSTWFEGKGERCRWTGQSSSHEMWHNENPREKTGTGKKDDCRATVKGWATMQWAHWASTTEAGRAGAPRLFPSSQHPQPCRYQWMPRSCRQRMTTTAVWPTHFIWRVAPGVPSGISWQ